MHTATTDKRVEPLDSTDTSGEVKFRPPETESITGPISEAMRVSRLGRATLYRLLGAGKIHAVKAGSRTLIVMDSLRKYLASLPAATFRGPDRSI